MSMQGVKKILDENPGMAFDRRCLAQRVVEEEGVTMWTALANVDRAKNVSWRNDDAYWGYTRLPDDLHVRRFITIYSSNLEGFDTLVMVIGDKVKRVPRAKLGMVKRGDRQREI